MAVSYKRLWKLLVDKEMSKSDLRKKAEIAPNRNASRTERIDRETKGSNSRYRR